MRYTVASVNAIQEFGGWAINDLTDIGAVDIDSIALDDDTMILEILNECGYTDGLTTDDTEIDGDGELLTLINFESGRPLYQLIYQDA